ncbi:MAG: NAD(P)-binding domain-containing protein, partial [Thermoproteota archaeon]|nr:NAD(P)-binding domain-containing protein [Thermoproteota archaeon]
MQPLQTTNQDNGKHRNELNWSIQDRLYPSFDKVLVIGLGQLGLPVAKYVKDRGFDVYGYDISTKALERAEKTAGIKKAINFSGFDVYI